MSRKGYHIYVDGSFLEESVGYGAVVLKDGSIHKEIYGYLDTPGAADYRNIGGELQAVIETVNWCTTHNINAVHIYYDYNGIAAWATGRWKAKKTLTQAYASFMYKTTLDITWHKVAGHSGDTWNDHADELAQKGALSGKGCVITSKKVLDAEASLRTKGDAFCLFLEDNGIVATCDKVYNRMYIRILIKRNGERIGIFDLYNTAKKPWSPYLHAFKASLLKQKVAHCWEAFCDD